MKLFLNEVDRDRGGLESDFLHEEVEVRDNFVSPLLSLKSGLSRLVMPIEL